MDDLKSQEELQYATLAVTSIITDLYSLLPSRLRHNSMATHLLRDLQTIESRSRSEGFGFFTRTLPRLGRAIVEMTETRSLRPCGFATGKSGLPRFLGGLTAHFHSIDDLLNDEDAHFLIGAFHQIGQVFYKYEAPFTDAALAKAEEKFLFVETQLSGYAFNSPVIAGARALIRRVLGDYSEVKALEYFPKHGPGVVADRRRANEKYEWKSIPQRLTSLFPRNRFFDTCGGLSHTRFNVYPPSESYSPQAARVIFVPKDSRGPRVISCEPSHNQWIQQLLRRYLEDRILAGTNGEVMFRDQAKNAQSALAASATKASATLDMSDASDRVSTELVRALLPHSWFRALNACRSQIAILPSGKQCYLKKFAPMGSAVCFPIEALVFWALVKTITQSRTAGEVRVYGDDIICPAEKANEVMDTIEVLTPLRFNRAKCFIKGSFRESCGTDAFNGVDITPIRIRQPVCGPDLLQRIAVRADRSNHFYLAGYWHTASALQPRGLDVYPVSSTNEHVRLVSYSSTTRLCGKTRSNLGLQRIETRGIVARPKRQVSKFASPMARMRRNLIRAYDENRRFDDLEIVTVPNTVNYYVRWVPVT